MQEKNAFDGKFARRDATVFFTWMFFQLISIFYCKKLLKTRHLSIFYGTMTQKSQFFPHFWNKCDVLKFEWGQKKNRARVKILGILFGKMATKQ
jgi:hypothetical protein